MLRVGVIGLGQMGEGMAMNLVAKGFPTVVHDLRPEPVERLAALGAEPAATAFEVGQQSDVAMVAVFSGDEVEDVMLRGGSDDGLIAGMDAGGIICVNSTVSPELIRRLAEAAGERGIVAIDVAMSGGGDTAARAGKLTFMAGGEVEVFERCRPVLEAMATTVHHVGPLGAGVTSKIINNYLAIQNVSSVREALRLSAALGFEEEAILAIVNSAVGASWASEHWAAIRIQEANHTLGPGGIALMASKDLHLAADLGRDTNTPMPLLNELIDNILPDLERHGMTGERPHSQ